VLAVDTFNNKAARRPRERLKSVKDQN
jgi:hypothetical protein